VIAIASAARSHRGWRQALHLPIAVRLPLGDVAKRRLSILRQTEDGFRIAEEDLRLRGAGEVLGTRQSGLPTLRLADLAIHEELVAIAHDDARLVLERDPHLESERGQALRSPLPVPPRRSRAVPLGRLRLR
jgi:RecG-like helicase